MKKTYNPAMTRQKFDEVADEALERTIWFYIAICAIAVTFLLIVS